MNHHTMRQLGNDRLDQVIRDADAARLFGISGNQHHSEQTISDSVSMTIASIFRCRWQEAESRLEYLSQDSGGGLATAALSSLLGRLTGRAGRVKLAYGENQFEPDGRKDASSWAAWTAATALGAWLGTDRAEAPAGSHLIHEMCEQARQLGPEVRDFVCLSLALLARATHDPVLGSFLLGRLSDTTRAMLRSLESGTLPHGTSPASPAAAGLCFLSLGDAETGRRILLGVVDSPETLRMPLVEGLVDAEMVRVSSENGEDGVARRWSLRTQRFDGVYGCRLPAAIPGN